MAQGYGNGGMAMLRPKMARPVPYADGGMAMQPKMYMSGGEVDGPGGPREDKIPAMLSDGEYVLPAKTVKAIGGPAQLDQLVRRTNDGREPGPTMKNGLRQAALGGYFDAAKEMAGRAGTAAMDGLRSAGESFRGAGAEPPAPPPAPPPAAAPATPTAPAAAGLTSQEAAKLERDERRARGGSLGERWELDPGTKQGRFLLRPYKPMYVLPVRWSDDPNQQPTSDGVGNSVSAPQDLRALEAAFQISLKSKIWETVGGSNLDVWLGYTQKSHWQVYTPALSRPFRETNYEPEVFGIWGIDQPLFLGWRARFLGLGFNHQSNGRSQPLSRSWNRIIAQAGFENGDWSVLARPWWRISESCATSRTSGCFRGRGARSI
jgi:hypothetical protein